ncbi:MAG: DUF881 domain-containing protein [Armatimonadetes bacterium]|nr:DUF881 domain-containing protein [Armatimonadota bacterium]
MGSARAHLIIATAALLVAFLAVLQVRTERQVRQFLGVSSPQLEELAYRMQREEQLRSELEAEAAALRRRLEALMEEMARKQRGFYALNMQLRALRLLAGLTPVEGPGVAIELSDNPRPLQPGENPNEVLLHYTDLARVVADLWAAGAEAVAINEERLVGTSGIECVGTTILVNQRRLVPPFLITAIGDLDRLMSEAGIRGGSLDMLKSFGFPVRITRLQSLRIPAYRGAMASAGAR